MSDGEISKECVVARSSVRRIANQAIEDGTLDAGYKKPHGELYLRNVRQESISALEKVLGNEHSNEHEGKSKAHK